MDIEGMNEQLSRLASQSSEKVQALMSSENLNNPETMLKAQFALQQCSIFVGFQSAVMKNVRDMVQGIISKL